MQCCFTSSMYIKIDKSFFLNKWPTEMHVIRQNSDASKAIILDVLKKKIFKECKIS